MKSIFYTLIALLTAQASIAQISASFESSYRSGIFDGGGTEILAYDPTTQQVFSTNGHNNALDIISLSNVGTPTRVRSIDLSPYGGGVNSVASMDTLVAVAVQNTITQNNGKVVFFNTSGTFLRQIEVGALPDMLIFTPDGKKVLTANEGEPNDDYTVDPEGSVSIIDLSNGVTQLTQTDVTTLSFAGVHVDPTVRVFGLNASPAQDFEPEYIAINKTSDTAYVVLQENNGLATINLTTNTFISVKSFGFKNHSLANNSLDASNRDNGIHFRTYPNLFGMYQPDAIKYLSLNGKSYILTANEGDSRDYAGFSEEERVKDLTLDPVAFPNAATLQTDSLLGRLKVTNTLGDTDNDGDFDALYVYGARSFSIWNVDNANLSLVYDSGDDFEKQLATADPTNFNSNNDDNSSFDSRSDDKGPEPEAIEIIQDSTYTYAFIGLERMGGFMIYNISDPNNVSFVNYLSTRDFSATETAAEDMGPEDLLFIRPSESPNGQGLVLISNEVSGSISVYSLSGLVNTQKTQLPTATFEAFPNPLHADNQLHLSKLGTYRILSSTGQLLREVTHTRRLDMSNLPKGIYFIQNEQGQTLRIRK